MKFANRPGTDVQLVDFNLSLHKYLEISGLENLVLNIYLVGFGDLSDYSYGNLINDQIYAMKNTWDSITDFVSNNQFVWLLFVAGVVILVARKKNHFKNLCEFSFKDLCIFCEKDPIPILFFLSLVGCFLIAMHQGSIRSDAITLIMWAAAFMAIGSLLGFTFAIPKTSKDYVGRKLNNDLKSSPKSSFEDDRLTHQVNTNFVEISDWLTKIIVGVGLVEIKDIGQSLHALAEEIGSSMISGDVHNHVMFVQALIIYFSVIGFLFGYLYTRLKLGPEISQADFSTTASREEIHELKIQVNDIGKSIKISDSIRIVSSIVDDFDAKRISADKMELTRLLQEAEKEIGNGLRIDKLNPECLKQKARIYRRKAELATEEGDDTGASSYWKEAIEFLNTAINNNQRTECRDVYYNRACYRNLTKAPISKILSDLDKAFKIDHPLKEFARHDPDLSNLQNDEEFEKL